MNLFDMHCDTLYTLAFQKGSLRKNQGHIDLERAFCYNHYAQFFALFCGAEPLGEQDAPKMLEKLLDTARLQFAENADAIVLCRSSKELEKARKEGKTAGFLSIEGAELLQGKGALEAAYKAGVRLVTLSWNHKTVFCSGAAADNKAGLTKRGCGLVKQLDSLGILIDVSHLSEQGFWDVCANTDKPFVASHSNARAVCQHLRNLTDEQFLEIVRRSGIIGVNLYAPFLKQGGQASICDVLKHIEHFLSLGGEKSLAIGADFDGCDDLPEGIRGLEDMHLLYEAMVREFGQSAADAICYDNLYRFVLTQL